MEGSSGASASRQTGGAGFDLEVISKKETREEGDVLSGAWEMGNAKIGIGKWEMGNGKWEMGGRC
jgi:hypothetical protein